MVLHQGLCAKGKQAGQNTTIHLGRDGWGILVVNPPPSTSIAFKEFKGFQLLK
jgi:hypothetical protein